MPNPTQKCIVCEESGQYKDLCDKCYIDCCAEKGLAILDGTQVSYSFIDLIHNYFSTNNGRYEWHSQDGKIYTKRTWRWNPAIQQSVVCRSKFYVGDPVFVKDTGRAYSTYLDWAQQHSLTQYKHGVMLGSTGHNPLTQYKVIAIGWHGEFARSGVLVGIEDPDGKQWIIGEKGLVFAQTHQEIQQPVEQTKIAPIPIQVWNCKCSICGSDAYQGLIKIECSNPNCQG